MLVTLDYVSGETLEALIAKVFEEPNDMDEYDEEEE